MKLNISWKKGNSFFQWYVNFVQELPIPVAEEISEPVEEAAMNEMVTAAAAMATTGTADERDVILRLGDDHNMK